MHRCWTRNNSKWQQICSFDPNCWLASTSRIEIKFNLLHVHHRFQLEICAWPKWNCKMTKWLWICWCIAFWSQVKNHAFSGYQIYAIFWYVFFSVCVYLKATGFTNVAASSSSRDHMVSCWNRHHLCWNATHYIDCIIDRGHTHQPTLFACRSDSVCNMDTSSKRSCLQVHRDHAYFLRTIHFMKKRKQQPVAVQEHMPSYYPNLQSFASLLVAPTPAANRPPPDELPEIEDEIAFLSDLVAFPIQRPNRRPHPTPSSSLTNDDADFGEWPVDFDEKPVETAAEPFRCRFFGRYAHPTDCRRYYQCYGSGANYSERWCDDGLAFNPRWLRCETDWSNCKDIPWCKANNQLLPDFHDRQHYFICIRRSYIFFVEDYSVYRRTCPAGEVFNLLKQTCNEPHPKWNDPFGQNLILFEIIRWIKCQCQLIFVT